MIAALHALGFFFLLFVLVAPHRYRLGPTGAFVIGTGITAYVLGLRHALDAEVVTALAQRLWVTMPSGPMLI